MVLSTLRGEALREAKRVMRGNIFDIILLFFGEITKENEVNKYYML